MHCAIKKINNVKFIFFLIFIKWAVFFFIVLNIDILNVRIIKIQFKCIHLQILKFFFYLNNSNK